MDLNGRARIVGIAVTLLVWGSLGAVSTAHGVGVVEPTWSGGESPATATAISQEDRCAPPLELRERAKQLRAELTSLDEGIVDQDTLASIDARIEHGETNLNLDRYCAAKKAYRSAINLAHPALKDAYIEAARNELDEIDRMLATERADGNPDPDVGALQERSERLRKQLGAADALSERRDLYQRTQDLMGDTRSNLPTTLSEQTIEAIVESPFVSGIAALLFLVVVVETYALIRVYRGKEKDRPALSTRGD